MTDLHRTIRLIIGPALNVGRSSGGSREASFGLISITRDLNPFLRGGQIVVVVPICLGSSVGSSVTKPGVLWNALGFKDRLVMAIGQGCCSRLINFSKTWKAS